jgi:hypothetical protein
MVVTISSELEAALIEQARLQGIGPETLALDVLRQRFLGPTPLQPRDEWERGLLDAARDWGCSLPDSALTSEGLND